MAGRSSCIRAMKRVYDVTISGESMLVTVTNQADAITEWINVVNADRRNQADNGFRYVGFEVELDFSSTRIGTLQLCVGMHCLVIQLGCGISPAFPPSLNEFVVDSNNIFVGFRIKEKLKMLREQVPIGVELMREVDLAWMVHMVNKKEKVFGMYELGAVEYDWGRSSNLSYSQVQYACIDALLNLKVGIDVARPISNILYPAARS